MQFVLVLNCGSSSLKFAVMNPTSGDVLLNGTAERLGHDVGSLTVKDESGKAVQEIKPGTHAQALELIVETLKTKNLMDKIAAVGHRLVHGGEFFKESVVINNEVREKVAECIRLAPLHNPANITGIEAALKVFPKLPQVGVFDTAFHQQMPEKAYLYPLPRKFYEEFHIRRYGFHGTSFRYIASQLESVTGLKNPRTVVCHLGNGGSLAAIKDGHSVDTTMGLTPLEGIVHGTRCGDIDPAIIQILQEQFHISATEMNEILWKKSGLLGLSGISNDCRSLEEAMAEGNEAAIRALEVYCYRLAKHIAAQMVALNGCDALVFTGGIGENSAFVRAKTMEQLAFLGFELDKKANEETSRGKQGKISTANSKPVWVIPTNEELLIARDTAQLSGMTR